MATIFTMKNGLSVVPLCRFTLYRFTKVGAAAGLDIETPCHLCVIPGGLCNLIEQERVWHFENPLSGWQYQFADVDQQSLFEGLFTHYALEFDTACHWIASQSDSGGGITAELDWDLEVTINGTDSSKIDLSLDLTITITGDFSDSKTVTYSLTSVSPSNKGPFMLTSTVNEMGRTFDLPGLDSIIFPEKQSASFADPI